MLAYRLENFIIDGLPGLVFEGYTYGEYWNGWETPVFPFETAVKIIEALQDDTFLSTYEEETDTFIIAFEDNEEMTEKYEGLSIKIGEQLLKVYPIGAYCWTWDVVVK